MNLTRRGLLKGLLGLPAVVALGANRTRDLPQAKQTAVAGKYHDPRGLNVDTWTTATAADAAVSWGSYEIRRREA